MDNIDNINNSIIYILNNKNKYITESEINNIFKRYKIDYKIKKVDIFQQALIHKSYIISNISLNTKYNEIISQFNKKYKEYNSYVQIQKESYERLEFLGDSLIKPVITKYICDRFKNQNEGFLSEFRTKIESTECLSILFEKMNLVNNIILSNEYEEVRLSKNIHEDCFEAFIGALYEDGEDIGEMFKLINKFIITIIETEIDIPELIKSNINYKKELNEYCHKKQITPHYYVAQKKFDENNQLVYKCIVKVNNIEGIGFGNNKKNGEQNAAKTILEKLKKIENTNIVSCVEINTYVID